MNSVRWHLVDLPVSLRSAVGESIDFTARGVEFTRNIPLWWTASTGARWPVDAGQWPAAREKTKALCAPDRSLHSRRLRNTFRHNLAHATRENRPYQHWTYPPELHDPKKQLTKLLDFDRRSCPIYFEKVYLPTRCSTLPIYIFTKSAKNMFEICMWEFKYRALRVVRDERRLKINEFKIEEYF